MKVNTEAARQSSPVRLAVFVAVVVVGAAAVLGYRHYEQSKVAAEYCARLKLDSVPCAARMAENKRSWERQ